MARKPADAFCLVCGEAPCICNRKIVPEKKPRVFRQVVTIEHEAFVAPSNMDQEFTDAIRLLADQGMLAPVEMERYKMLLERRPPSISERAQQWRTKRGTNGTTSAAG